MSYHNLFEGIYIVLSYSTDMGGAYVAANLFKIKKTSKLPHSAQVMTIF